ncbi:MAG: hypothetical protein JSS86_17370 [Cyanobacteria bacterium SZAS LIN-2]|nr:hypothetical protein [Cyanobacteria bacterium SZAS LIN-2]
MHSRLKQAAAAVFVASILALSAASAVLAEGQRHAPTSYLPQARQMYRAKRYAEASRLYGLAIQNEGAGAGGYLYMAHCEYMLGHLSQALHYYQFITQNYRALPEAKSAALYVAQLEPIARKQTRMLAHVSLSSMGAQGTTLLDRFEIVRPTAGHPEVSTATIDSVKEFVRSLPPQIQSLLQTNGIKFCITPTLIDKDPALGYQEGRGYDGYTYKRCPGMFKGNTVIICERLVDEGSNEVEAPLPVSSIANTFHHEVGHALDSCLGNFSASEDYRHPYYLDVARIPADGAGSVSYYTQKSLAGQQESCAEITANVLGHGGVNAPALRAYFPQSMLAIRKKLNIE